MKNVLSLLYFCADGICFRTGTVKKNKKNYELAGSIKGVICEKVQQLRFSVLLCFLHFLRQLNKNFEKVLTSYINNVKINTLFVTTYEG